MIKNDYNVFNTKLSLSLYTKYRLVSFRLAIGILHLRNHPMADLNAVSS